MANTYVRFDKTTITAERPLPFFAFRSSILNNPNTVASVRSYAHELIKAYPQQQSLITDIAQAAQSLKSMKDRAQLRRQLVDLEYYLQMSR